MLSHAVNWHKTTPPVFFKPVCLDSMTLLSGFYTWSQPFWSGGWSLKPNCWHTLLLSQPSLSKELIQRNHFY